MTGESKSFFENKTHLFVAIIVLLAIGAIVVLTLPHSTDNSTPTDFVLNLEIGSSPVLGLESAPVTIYEFSDFSCPYCAAAEGKNQEVMDALGSKFSGWQAPLPAIKENYIDTGKVKLVFKYYPGHGAAIAAHSVALGLQAQNPELFWKFAEEAFARQTTNLNDLNKMISLAVEIGANETELNTYLNSGSAELQLTADKNMAKNNGVGGTPTFFINGKKVEGAQSFDAFRNIIDNELAK